MRAIEKYDLTGLRAALEGLLPRAVGDIVGQHVHGLHRLDRGGGQADVANDRLFLVAQNLMMIISVVHVTLTLGCDCVILALNS